MARVLVALSGGVDSAVAAALLVERGHEVTAVHGKLADLPAHEQVPGQGCCTLDDAQDARRVAQVLGVPFYVWDLSARFRTEVQEPFAQAYAAGLTPNPCVTCNEKVKYAGLLEQAAELGFDAVATGHHARLRRGGVPVHEPGPEVELYRARDRAKDQSYVLYMASPEQLSRTLLPVGELTKDEVRSVAAAHGLRVASKPESFDICFIPDGDTAGYLARHLPPAPGAIVDIEGQVLGHHDGVWRFTVGQRRGLGLAGVHVPSSQGRPARRFVVDVDPARAEVVVGARELLACEVIELGSVSWTTGTRPRQRVRVQIRAHGETVTARLEQGDEHGDEQGGTQERLVLDEPLYAAARGQAAVIYDLDDERCLGGGPIRDAFGSWMSGRGPRPASVRPGDRET